MEPDFEWVFVVSILGKLCRVSGSLEASGCDRLAKAGQTLSRMSKASYSRACEEDEDDSEQERP